MKWFTTSTLKAIGIILFLVFAVFLVEALYYFRVYSEIVARPEKGYDLVLFYGGAGSVDQAVKLAMEGPTALFISGDESEAREALREVPKDLLVVSDPRALTTDQNARYSAPFIRQKGCRRVLLVTGWDHLPRALFLTRFYLMGSGVTVIPCANSPAPKDWWRYPETRVQLFKFWGSLGRIILHEIGINDWPTPEWMP